MRNAALRNTPTLPGVYIMIRCHVRIHRAAQLVGDVSERAAQLFLIGVVHGCVLGPSRRPRRLGRGRVQCRRGRRRSQGRRLTRASPRLSDRGNQPLFNSAPSRECSGPNALGARSISSLGMALIGRWSWVRAL